MQLRAVQYNLAMEITICMADEVFFSRKICILLMIGIRTLRDYNCLSVLTDSDDVTQFLIHFLLKFCARFS